MPEQREEPVNMLSPIYLPPLGAPTQNTEAAHTELQSTDAAQPIPPVTAVPGHIDDWVTLTGEGNHNDYDGDGG